MLTFTGDVDAEALLSFYPIENITQASGVLSTDIAFEGRLSFWKREQQLSRCQRADRSTRDLDLTFNKNDISITNLNGVFQFNNNDLALSNVSGTRNSDFRMNGFFKNIITFILFENQPVGIEADLKSSFLNVDELFSYAFGKENSSGSDQEYEFKISPNVYLNFNCNVNRLTYKRFSGRSLQGDLLIKSQVALSRNIQVKTMGGNLSLNGTLNAVNPKAIAISNTFKLDGLSADSIFYVFENFDQTFIQDKHLKGKAYADVSMELTLNQNLKLFQETLVADIATIKNGELNQFEPLKQLNKYLDDGLSALRFADLKMKFTSRTKPYAFRKWRCSNNRNANQRHTHLWSTHWLQDCNASESQKIDINEAGSAIEEMEGRAKLYLKIIGTTDNYRVLYDTEAVKRKIADDLKKEVKELKDILQNKKKKKEVQLSTDEFDWDN